MPLIIKFTGAINFKNDLCPWERALPLLGKSMTRSIFVATSCLVTAYPAPVISNITSFCYPCESPSRNATNTSSIDNIFSNVHQSVVNFDSRSGSRPILDRQELYKAVDEYLENSTSISGVALKYGYPIGTWNVSQIVDFSSTFDYDRNPLVSKFTEDLNGWDTSSAESMARMFSGASFFNGDISTWSTTGVKTMEAMFKNAYSFNGNISSWDTSRCMNMASMFEGADLFNGNVSLFDTSIVVDMSGMFLSAISFEGEGLAHWHTSAVTTMKALFAETFSFRRDVLSLWNVSSVVDMAEIFQYSTFNGDISGWDVSNVNDFQYSFSGAGSFNHNLSPWNVSMVTSFNGMVIFCLRSLLYVLCFSVVQSHPLLEHSTVCRCQSFQSEFV
jgi:Mycoplasma protein of unknown function, DUF285